MFTDEGKRLPHCESCRRERPCCDDHDGLRSGDRPKNGPLPDGTTLNDRTPWPCMFCVDVRLRVLDESKTLYDKFSDGDDNPFYRMYVAEVAQLREQQVMPVEVAPHLHIHYSREAPAKYCPDPEVYGACSRSYHHAHMTCSICESDKVLATSVSTFMKMQHIWIKQHWHGAQASTTPGPRLEHSLGDS